MTARLGCTALTLFLFIGIVSHAAGDDSRPKKTELEGTWVAVKKDSGAQQLIFTGNKFEAKFNGKVVKGTFTLNNKENPLEIDLKITSSTAAKYKGKTALGIYDFQGANLRWCSSQPGRKRRPSQFARVMGDARLILGTFKQKK